MINPFEQADAMFLVLVNDEDQYSLWPSAIEIPAGWKPVLGPVPHEECVRHVEANWTDMRPRSMRASGR
jgi:MbtH protein